MLLNLLLTAGLVLLTSASQQQPSVVTLRQGALRGQYERAIEGRQYVAFRGIPYAEPPVGDLRFRPPRAHQGWSGERDASQHGPMCLQYDMIANFSRRGEEDCLYLNVYTPRLPPKKPVSSLDAAAGLPVMVWIHGGGFYSGSGDNELFGVDYLLEENVVVVSINYRLSIFGFLSTDDAAAPGNYGLLDQVMALRWVRDNIAEFGGNPQLVTVFGESAGGASVSLQVISPLSRGLFHRAISQSGAAGAPWSMADGPQLHLVKHYAKELQCPTDTTRAALECLRHASAEDIMRVQGELGFSVGEKSKYFKPCVDAAAPNPFLPESPFTLLTRGHFNKVPWMMGMAKTEGAFMLGFLLLTDNTFLSRALSAGDEFWSSVELIRGAQLVETNPLKAGKQIKEFFEQQAGGLSAKNLSPLMELMGDWHFNLPITLEAEMASRYVPVYSYLLDHTGAGRMRFNDVVGGGGWPDLGVTHADDLAYLFKGRRQDAVSPSSPEYQMIRLLVSLWTSFARLGYPTSEVFSMPDWPVYNAVSPAYVRLNSEPSISSGLLKNRIEFWKSLLTKEWWKLAQQKKTTRDEL